MSTILKALQRLEEEKDSNPERSLDEQVLDPRVGSPPRGTPGAGRGLVVSLSLFVGLAVGGAALYMWPFGESEADSSPPVVAAAKAEEPPLGTNRNPSRRSPVNRPFVEPTRTVRKPAPPSPPPISNQIEIVRRIEASPLVENAEPRVPTAEERALILRELNRKSAEARVVAAAATPPAAKREAPALPEPSLAKPKKPSEFLPRELAAVVPDPPKPTPPVIASPPSKPAAAPKIQNVAKSKSVPGSKAASKPTAKPTQDTGSSVARRVLLRAPLPEIRLQRTIWHPDSTRRTAVVEVNGESLELHLGDAVGPLVLTEIEPSGVFFSHDGVEIRHRVGE